MNSILKSLVTLLVALVFPTVACRAHGDLELEKVGSTESEIHSFLETWVIPLEKIQSNEAHSLFEELERLSGITFILPKGVQGDFNLDSTEEITLKRFLEETLSEQGYTARRQPGTKLIWISADLVTQRFSLSPNQIRHLQVMVGNGATADKDSMLRNRILGKPTTSRGTVKFTGHHLTVTDTNANIRKVKAYLDRHDPVDFQSFSSLSSYAPPPNRVTDLRARRSTVSPVEDRGRGQSDSNIRRTRQVNSAQRVIGGAPYGSQSIEEAAASGRVILPNPEEGSISIVDTPRNLRKVEGYLQGGSYRGGGLRRVYRSQHRTPNDLSGAVRGVVLYTIP